MKSSFVNRAARELRFDSPVASLPLFDFAIRSGIGMLGNCMITSTTEIRVRYAETDMMGVAYHGNYMAWFEMARVNMLDELGCPYRELEANGFRLPVLEVSVRYRRPVTFDDRVTVEARIEQKPSLRIRIDYTLRCHEKITAEGFTLHAFINPQGQPVRPPPEFVQLMDREFGK